MRERWDRLCERIGAFGRAEESDLTFEMLATMYAHPPRTYHTLSHIEDCLSLFDRVRMLAEEPDQLEFALWLHDCVFVAERPDNEARSADAAAMLAGLLGCPAPFVDGTRRLILITRHDQKPERGDLSLIGDIDLSILGAEPERYEAYRRAIRQEYAFADDAMFNAGRHAFLERMLARDSIYNTPLFAEELEERARRNLETELDLLEER